MYFSLVIFASIFRISARARKARTLTSGTDQPVISRDFLDRPLLDFQQGDDQPGGGRQAAEDALDQLAGRLGMLVGGAGFDDELVEPVGFRLGKFGEGGFAVALVGAEEIVAGAYRQAHEPMLKGRLAPETRQLLEGLDENLLDDVLHFALPPRVAAGGGKNARLILDNQRLEAGRIPLQHGGDQLRVGGLHCSQRRVMPKACSNSAENLATSAMIKGGCWLMVASILSRISGRNRINSRAATTMANWLLISWRMCPSFLFNSANCSAVNVAGVFGTPICRPVCSQSPAKSSSFARRDGYGCRTEFFISLVGTARCAVRASQRDAPTMEEFCRALVGIHFHFLILILI